MTGKVKRQTSKQALSIKPQFTFHLSRLTKKITPDAAGAFVLWQRIN